MRKFLSLITVLVLFDVSAFAQGKIISGKITDQQGAPVSFADAEGNFLIKAQASQTLIISGTGVTEQEVLVGSGNSLAIQVVKKGNTLSEVVVTTALGIQRQAKSLGYSTAKV